MSDIVARSEAARGEAAKSEARLRQPPDKPLKDALTDRTGAALPIQWQPMDTAPKDGRPVFLRRGEEAVECYWRFSRRFDAKRRNWEPFFYWCRVLGPPVMIDFEPEGWFRAKDKSKELSPLRVS